MKKVLFKAPRLAANLARPAVSPRLAPTLWGSKMYSTKKFTDEKASAPQNTPPKAGEGEKVTYTENYDENQLKSMAQDKAKLAKKTTEAEAKKAAKPQLDGKESLKGV